MLRSFSMAMITLLASMALLPDALSQQSTTATASRAETELSKTVVFITLELRTPNRSHDSGRTAGANPITLHGTGFLITVPDSRLPSGRVFSYLATNRHVAEAIEQDEEGRCVRHEIQRTYVTLNLKEPVNGERAVKQTLALSSEYHWYFPSAEAVDLAVIPFVPANENLYDTKKLSIEQLLPAETIEKDNIVPGDPVLTVGFFFAYAGLHQIQPIVREGVLAMLPDGPMTTTMCEAGNVYLADVHITPGNSGSPIFIIPKLGLGSGVSLTGSPNVFGLLGVVSGYMQETSDLTLRASTTWSASVHANSGVSVIVPAQQLKDLLEAPELRALRDETVRQMGLGEIQRRPRPK
ncbi:MAG: trypsin-like peptidase domain-containing protein [Terracidiphilus sp.]